MTTSFLSHPVSAEAYRLLGIKAGLRLILFHTTVPFWGIRLHLWQAGSQANSQDGGVGVGDLEFPPVTG